eukprot:gene28269-13725_t
MPPGAVVSLLRHAGALRRPAPPLGPVARPCARKGTGGLVLYLRLPTGSAECVELGGAELTDPSAALAEIGITAEATITCEAACWDPVLRGESITVSDDDRTAAGPAREGGA